eukprot:gene40921-50627_t
MAHALTAGLSLKPQHFDDALQCNAPGLWWEVHPENYLADGGPRLAWLQAIRGRHPISLHGVSLSLAADAPPDAAHLARLAALVQRTEPVRVSEHLAWSAWRGTYHPDLLPFPRTHEALARVADNIGRTQDALRRTIAIENPTHYLPLPGHDWSEPDFLAELVRRTGCSLLLDVNNLYLSAHNLGEPSDLDAYPLHAVAEIHLAGHQVARAAQAHGVELHEHHVTDQRFGKIGVLAQRKGHVFKYAQVGEQRAKLEQHAHAAAHSKQARRVHAAHLLPIKQHLAVLGTLLPTNQTQHRGFATARGPHQRRDFASRHLQRYVAQDHPVPIGEGHVAQINEGRSVRHSKRRESREDRGKPRLSRTAIRHNGHY